MLGKLFILTALVLVQGRPQEDVPESTNHETSYDYRCRSDWSHHLLPHEYDCTKFYYCEYGYRWITPRDCAPGTHFSYELQVCVHPPIANCNLTGVPIDPPESTNPPPTELPTELPTTPEAEDSTTAEVTTEETEAPTDPPSTRPPTTHRPTKPPTTQPEDTEAPTDPPSTRPPTTHRPTKPPTTQPEDTEAPTDPPSTRPPTTHRPTKPPTTQPEDTEAPTDPPSTRPPTTHRPTKPPTRPPTESEDLPNGCPKDFEEHRLLPHETECNKFYYCDFGELLERECDEGTYFNAEEQVCDHPWNVDCSGSETGPGVPGWLENGCPRDFEVHHLLPHEKKCNLFYYCNFGELVLRECGEGTHFNPELQVCDWPENAGCASGNPPVTEDPTDPDDTTDPEELTTRPPRPTKPPTTPAPGEDLDNGCPSNFSEHRLLPHETECHLFYYCVFGELVLSECGEGTHFNPVLQVCDWPESAGCANGIPPVTEDPTDPDDTTDPEKPTTRPPRPTKPPTTPAPGEDLDNGCPSNFSEHRLLPHETECHLFYYCVFGELVLSECGEGTHFNPVLQVCDWPESAGCANGIPPVTEDPTDPDDTTEPEKPTTRPPRPTKPPTTPAPGEDLDNGCPSNFSEHRLLPHETECHLFYYCVFGELVLSECGEGTHFNPVLQVCDWPESAGCANGIPPVTEDPTDPDDTTEPEKPTTRPPRPTKPPTTPAPGEDLDNGCPSNFSEHRLLPHETECHLFYYCVFGKLVLSECGEGTHFNPVLQVCDWPESAGCANGNPPVTEDPTDPDDTTDPEKPTTRPPRPTKPPTTPAPGEDLDNGCPSNFSEHRLLPHETECHLFYYCVFGELVLSECGEGTHFNPVLQVCDWPESAGCANGIPPVTEDPTDPDDTTDPEKPTTRPPRPTKPPTTPAPGEDLDNGCPSNFSEHRLLPHETECHLFYYCVFGELVLSECGEGTHFNPVLQVCDWPESAGCANGIPPVTEDPTDPDDTTDPEKPTTRPPRPTKPPTTPAPGEDLDNGCPSNFSEHRLLPHETECHLFYYCVFGELVLSECGEGTHFNPVLQVCDWPESAGCANGIPPVTEDPTDPDDTTDPEKPTTRPPRPTKPPTTPAPGEDLDNGCPSNFSEHRLLPHETECHLFYYCVFGELVLSECGEGTHFNPVLQVCDWPESAGCANGIPPVTEDPTDPDDTTDPEKPTTRPPRPTKPPTTPAPGEDLDNGCPSNFSEHRLLPHETECHLFYYCVFGELVLSECGEGTHFNPVLQVCDWPESAGCANGIPPVTEDPTDPDDTTDPEKPTTRPPRPTKPPTTPAPGEDLDNGCPSNFSEHRLLPHETECHLFYYCVFGELVLSECGEGTHFNPVLQVCDWPHSAGCISGTEAPPTDKPSTRPPRPPTGKPSTRPPRPPTDEPSTRPPRPPTDKPSTRPPRPPTDEPSTRPPRPTIRPSTRPPRPPTDEPSTRPPRPPTVEPSTRPPRPPTDKPSTRPPRPPTDKPSTRPPRPPTDKPSTRPPRPPTDEPSTRPPRPPTDKPSTRPPRPPTTTPAPEDLDNGCPANFSEHRLLPHETECHLFYYCVFGELVESECSDGLHFNAELQVCDWPENAGCASDEDLFPPPVETDRCEEECNILPWAHARDCDKYWRCDGGTSTLVVCAEGLHFNEYTGTCDFICNAGCDRRNIQATGNAQGLRVFLPWYKVGSSVSQKFLEE